MTEPKASQSDLALRSQLPAMADASVGEAAVLVVENVLHRSVWGND